MTDESSQGSICKSLCLWTLWIVFLALPSVLSFVAIVVLGAIGINNAETDNDERYIRAYCSDADNSEHVWLYWMAGSSGAAFLLWLFGTFTIVVGVYLLTTLNSDLENKSKPLQKMTCGAAIAVLLTMFFLLVAVLCLLWCVALAYNNARTPNKTVDLYILVDGILGIVMPVSLAIAGTTASVFLMYITKGHIDVRDIIAKLLSIKLKNLEDARDCWVIHNTFYFQLDKHDTEVKKKIDGNKPISFCEAISSSWSTLILATIVSVSFLLSMSYFIDRTVTMSQILQDWPDRNVGDVDCFLSNSFLYVSPIEQGPTDRLNNCTMFFEQCQSNCSADDFQSCVQECANCLTSLCTTTIRSALEMVRVCDPPSINNKSQQTNNEGPSCAVSNAACINITAATLLPQDNSSCQVTQGTSSSGDASVEIAPIIVSNNTQRLERCVGILETCSIQVSMCTSPNCTELQQCNTLLQDCRKPPVIICFSFLQFGRSTNVLQALAESNALFLFAISLLSAIFAVVRILLHIKETKWWGVGFVIVAVLLIAVGVPVLVTSGIFFVENIIRLLQFGLPPIYIFLIGLLFPVAYFPTTTTAHQSNQAMELGARGGVLHAEANV